MSNKKYLFTSESVTEGHPDKVCDQISDAFLDAVYSTDPNGRVAVETMVTTGLVIVAGEVTTDAYVEVQDIVRDTLKKIGYDKPEYGFNYCDVGVLNSIHSQSPDISQGVTETEEREQGAGDQGMMFGYASNETKELMPLPIVLAHKLCMKLADVRKNKTLDYLRPDGKSQVTVEYNNGFPAKVKTVVIAAQHDEDVSEDKVKKDIIEKVVKPVCKDYIDDETTYHVNSTGRFVIGGPPGDTGVTGRKIIVDTYGGHGSHGGGCFSGKDPSKVDRSASYMARYVAKNIVAAGLSDKCEIQVAYSIGVAEPVSILINTFGTNKIPEEKIEELVRKHFSFKPANIIKTLDLRRPIYRKTAAYGHFGRNEPEFTWEKTDKAETLRNEAGIREKAKIPAGDEELEKGPTPNGGV
ncbi:MAG: methionine adenosyltransferase [Candidatus Nanoarchaeia archaeon]|nr:methionine adenosyltransferase [Candidatus Nanoarchaeia archaeon]